MTPDEKAKQLYETMYYKTPNILVERAKDMMAKSCAIICCDEVLNVLAENGTVYPYLKYQETAFWKSVKQHIQSL